MGVAATLVGGRRAKNMRAAPKPTPATVTYAFENELGVQPPAGFRDPAGFTSDGDTFDFYRRRCVEVKHGRVAMLACIGYIVQEFARWPGVVSTTNGTKFADIPNGLAALLKVPAVGWTQVLFFCGYMELFAAYQDPDLEPGKLSSRLVVALTEVKDDVANRYTFGPFGIINAESIKDPEIRKKKLQAEIANGRLAMMAIIGMFFQDGLTGSAWGDWSLYTASPLRAFESELGVQDPVGFWDPLGFTSDGDEAAFMRRRSVELKHGRVCMAATIGYIVPFYYKFPGYLSPSEGLKFADVPNGLAALSKVPALGWVQIIFFTGIVEGGWGVGEDYKQGTPGEFGWKVITSDDPAEKENKLAAELANGRLAMMAIIGMFFQDGLTG